MRCSVLRLAAPEGWRWFGAPLFVRGSRFFSTAHRHSGPSISHATGCSVLRGDRSMGRSDPFIRQHVLLRRLGRTRYGETLDELCGALVVDLGLSRLSMRTVRRDLEALQAAGYGVATERSTRGVVWRLQGPANDTILAGVSADELLALDAATAALTRTGQPVHARSLMSLREKLQAAAAETTLRLYERRTGMAGVDVGHDDRCPAENLQKLGLE